MKTIVAFVAVLLIAGCTLENGEGPAPTGPSEYALSVTLSASPDRLPRDGSSQSVITATVRDASSRPVSGQRLNVSSSAGVLSQTDVVTNGNGQASVTFTAPDVGTVGNSASIAFVPIGTNAANAVPRTISIAFIGPSNTSAPTFAPVPFTVIPGTPEVGVEATFDASGTVDTSGKPATGVFDEGFPCMGACTYVWDFGDGSTPGVGRVAFHTYTVGRTYIVALFVTDAAGSSAFATRTISVNAVPAPTVTLEVVPDPPYVDQQAVFTAKVTPVPGHSIRRYEWDFGDKTTDVTTTPTISKTYKAVGIYVATVVAIDDLGQAGRAAKSVNVSYAIAAPLANFTIVPSSPTAGASVTFNGSSSTVGAGASITDYLWDFGDGTPPQSSGTSPTYTRSGGYASANTYTATLTITDSLGRTNTKTASVKVN